MARYVLRRLLMMIPVVLGATILIFTIMYFTPGDPAQIILGPNATTEQLQAKRVDLGLDQPYLVRLGSYLENVFLHFDFGKSFVNNRSVSDEILARFPRTFIIAFFSVLLAVVIGVPLGIMAATHQNKLGDYISMFLALIGVSMPGFWIGLMLVIWFALGLHWLPAGGIGGVQYYILPCIATACSTCAALARQTRSSMLEVIRSDYIVTARSKGQTENKVIFRHALKNAMIPIITIAGNYFGISLGGALVIETVYSIPGLGMYIVSGINNRDYPVIQGSIVFVAISFSLVMLLVDLIYAYIDPRIKAQYQVKKKVKL